MTITSVPPITLDDLRAEFGGVAPNSLGDYYAGGGLVPSGTTGDGGPIPSVAPISLGDFYGASGVFTAELIAGVNGTLSGYDVAGVPFGSLTPDTFEGIFISRILFNSANDNMEFRVTGTTFPSTFWGEMTIVGPNWNETWAPGTPTLTNSGLTSQAGGDTFWQPVDGQFVGHAPFTNGASYTITIPVPEPSYVFTMNAGVSFSNTGYDEGSYGTLTPLDGVLLAIFETIRYNDPNFRIEFEDNGGSFSLLQDFFTRITVTGDAWNEDLQSSAASYSGNNIQWQFNLPAHAEFTLGQDYIITLFPLP